MEDCLLEDCLQVGVITSTHGIKGEVKVFPTTDDPKRFLRLKEIILDTGKEQITLSIEGVKFFKQFAILKFEGIDNIDDVERYRKKSLYVTRKNAVKLKRDEYFIADLVGLKVMAHRSHLSEIGFSMQDTTEEAGNNALSECSNSESNNQSQWDAAGGTGSECITNQDVVIGTLKDVLETGANDVYVISLNDGRELLLPAIKQCVLDVDIESGWIKVHILEGLLD